MGEKVMALFRRIEKGGLVALFNLLLLGGCAVGPNYQRPMAELPKAYTSKSLGSKTMATPAKFGQSQQFVANQDIPAEWWKLFHSKSLNTLIMEALVHNPNVGAAQAALRASLETAYAQRGALYPFIGLSFMPSKQQTAGVLQSLLADNAYNFSLYTGQVYVSYTLDVFGGTRRQIESLVAQAEFQRLQLEATYLTLSTNVVNAAIQEAALRAQISATQRIIKSQTNILTIFQKRLKLGDATLSDIATQEAALAASEATLPPLEKQLALQRNLLNALTGRFPDDERTPEFKISDLQLPTELPISIPSTLVEHRPDIRAAEEQMHSANALIGVAVANRLPNVTIGFTNAGTSALNLAALLRQDTLFWSLAGIIAQPIFDGGTLRHRQRIAKAQYEETAALYRLTVINAFQNVADTLKAIKSDAIALRTAHKAEKAAFKNFTISHRQLALGDSSSLNILVNEQLYQQAKLNVIQAEANRLSDSVALFQALGGGWWNKACKPR